MSGGNHQIFFVHQETHTITTLSYLFYGRRPCTIFVKTEEGSVTF